MKKSSMKRPRPKANKKKATRRSARMAKKLKMMGTDQEPSREPSVSMETASNDSPHLKVAPSVDEDDPPCPGSSISAPSQDPAPATSHQDHEDDQDVWMDQPSEEDDPPSEKSKVHG